jgi:hypothetical protein
MLFAIIVGTIIACIIIGIIFAAAGTPKHAHLATGFNNQMVCPHCRKKGKVLTWGVSQKKGISGGKATAALLTGGASLFATGLSRKERGTKAHCANCNNTWVF